MAALAGDVERIDRTLEERRRVQNPYRNRSLYEAAREAARSDPGRFHGEIAIREIHFYDPREDAWITFDDESRGYRAISARTGAPAASGLPPGHRPWTSAFDPREAPFYRWFSGAETNACFNEVDRHVALGHGDEVAILFEGDRWDPTLDGGRGGPAQSRRITRKELLCEVALAALVLEAQGLKKGDRVLLNLPNIPEQIFYTEAAKRLGVIYTPVFGGLSAKTVSDRLEDLRARLVVTADGGYRSAQIVPYKEAFVDPALDRYRPVAAVLARAREAIGESLGEGAAERLVEAFGVALRGELTVEPADAMQAFGRALDEAAEGLPSGVRANLRRRAAGLFTAPVERVDAVIVVRHTRQEIALREGRDLWSHDLLRDAEERLLAGARAAGHDVRSREDLLALPDQDFIAAVYRTSRPVPVDASFPLFVIYTSGSTGRPKGVVHAHAYVAGVLHTMRAAFGAIPGEDVIYVIADPGWITGQSYMISGALSARIQSVVAEGSPVFPGAGRFASIIARYGVTIFKAGATFLKGLMADGDAQDEVRRHSRDSLRVATFCAEPVSPAVQSFAMELLCAQYANSYWATEHGGIVFTHVYGNAHTPLRPDAHTWPLPWVDGDVWVAGDQDADGRLVHRPARDGEKGEIVLRSPYPYLARTIWGDADRVLSPDWKGDDRRWAETYWLRWAGVLAYTQGDFACRYEDGSFTLHGRSDDVINVAGHRIGTEEIEGAILRDRRRDPLSPVRNAVVVGAPHREKGLVPVAFIETPDGQPLPALHRAVLDGLVRTDKGAIAVPQDYIAVREFPETRSGKYMRRLLSDLLSGRGTGDVTALRNPEALDAIRPLADAWRRRQDLAQAQQAVERYRYLEVQHLMAGERSVALVTVENPPVNALNERLLDELRTVVDRLSARPEVAALVVTGRGGFVAGADVRQLLEDVQTAEEALALARKAQAVFSAIEALGKPAVAAVRGFALGGGNEFLAACHYAVAEPDARLGQPEIGLRLIPGYGGTQRLPRLLQAASGEEGLLLSLRLILGGRSIGALEAHGAGLIHEVARETDSLSRALALAREYALSGAGPLAEALAKRADLRAGWERPLPFPEHLLEHPEIRRILRHLEGSGRGGAARRALEALRTGFTLGFSDGLSHEAELFALSVVDPEGGRRGIRDFLDRSGESLPTRSGGSEPDEEELLARGDLLPLGAPFSPGFTPIPAFQYALGVWRDPESGAPRHGDPAAAEERLIVPVQAPRPDEALVYMLVSDVNFNDIWAATGIPVSPFDAHDEDVHISGSGGVGLVVALGAELRREGRLEIGGMYCIYPGQSDVHAPEMGLDPMAADFRIQGYETPDGTHMQFARVEGPQLLEKPEGVTIEAAAGFLLALGTVHRALHTALRVQPGRVLFAEGAATGTGLEAVKTAVRGGLLAAGMVSSDARAQEARAAGARIVLRRDAPELQGIFTPVPEDPALWAAWERDGQRLLDAFSTQSGGRLADYVLSHAGETAFPRSFQLLAPGGSLAFFGASSGYHFTFLGKSGRLGAEDACSRAGLKSGEVAVVHYGVGGDEVDDPEGIELIEAARQRGARIAVVARTDAGAEFVRSLGFGGAIAGVTSLEELRRRLGDDFEWPDTMPRLPDPRRETALFREAVRRFQEHTFKPLGATVGRMLRAPGNPRGQADVVFERAGHDALAQSVMLVRPLTGRVVYAEEMAGRRYSFFAPQVWMRQRRILMPSASILGTHLCNAHEAGRVIADVSSGVFRLTEPVLVPFEQLPAAHQEMWENRHRGASYVQNHALPQVGLSSIDELRAAWSRLRGD